LFIIFILKFASALQQKKNKSSCQIFQQPYQYIKKKENLKSKFYVTNAKLKLTINLWSKNWQTSARYGIFQLRRKIVIDRDKNS
jgi:hypothetical protein